MSVDFRNEFIDAVIVLLESKKIGYEIDRENHVLTIEEVPEPMIDSLSLTIEEIYRFYSSSNETEPLTGIKI